jgi:hypothetical protein
MQNAHLSDQLFFCAEAIYSTNALKGVRRPASGLLQLVFAQAKAI